MYQGFSFTKWNEYVVRFETGGLSTVDTGNSEFSGIVNRILPIGIKADYKEMIQFRDVDLAIMIKKIINSKRVLRYLARTMLYPIYWLAKI